MIQKDSQNMMINNGGSENDCKVCRFRVNELIAERDAARSYAETAYDALSQMDEAVRILTRFMKQSSFSSFSSSQNNDSSLLPEEVEDGEEVRGGQPHSLTGSPARSVSNRSRTLSNMSIMSDMSCNTAGNSNRIRTFSNMSVASYHSTDELRLSELVKHDSLPPRVGSDLMALSHACRMIVEQACWISHESSADLDEKRQQEQQASKFARKAERVARKFYEQNKLLKKQIKEEQKKNKQLTEMWNATLQNKEETFKRQQEESFIESRLLLHEHLLTSPKSSTLPPRNSTSKIDPPRKIPDSSKKAYKGTNKATVSLISPRASSSQTQTNNRSENNSLPETKEPVLKLDEEVPHNNRCTINNKNDGKKNSNAGFGSIFTTVPTFMRNPNPKSKDDMKKKEKSEINESELCEEDHQNKEIKGSTDKKTTRSNKLFPKHQDNLTTSSLDDNIENNNPHEQEILKKTENIRHESRNTMEDTSHADDSTIDSKKATVMTNLVGGIGTMFTTVPSFMKQPSIKNIDGSVEDPSSSSRNESVPLEVTAMIKEEEQHDENIKENETFQHQEENKLKSFLSNIYMPTKATNEQTKTSELLVEKHDKTSIRTNNNSASDNILGSKEPIPNTGSTNQVMEENRPDEGTETKDPVVGKTAATVEGSAARVENEEPEILKSKEENKLKSFFNSIHTSKQSTPKQSNVTTETPKAHEKLKDQTRSEEVSEAASIPDLEKKNENSRFFPRQVNFWSKKSQDHHESLNRSQDEIAFDDVHSKI